MTLAELPAQLADIHAREPDRRIVLKGDRPWITRRCATSSRWSRARFSGVSLQVEKAPRGLEWERQAPRPGHPE